MLLVHVTDTHVSRDAESLVAFERLIVQCNTTVRPSAIVVTGDVTGTGQTICGTGDVNIDGNVTISTFTASTGQTNIGGDFTSLSFTHNGGEIIFDISNNSSVTVTLYQDLTISDNINMGAGLNVVSTLIINNNFTI